MSNEIFDFYWSTFADFIWKTDSNTHSIRTYFEDSFLSSYHWAWTITQWKNLSLSDKKENSSDYLSLFTSWNWLVSSPTNTSSKCSFLDFEPIKKHEQYLGKRVKRGLFKSQSGKHYSADLNGSLNILRKVVGDSIFDRNSALEACS